MTGRRLAGILAPITTPFDPRTGELALGELRRNLGRYLADGLDGVVVAGSTGEAPLLDPAEVGRLVGAAREAVPDDRWLVAGTGAESTRQALALSRAAAEAGADLVLVRPPGYYAAGHSPESLADYYRAVADASPVPVLVYNIPKYTHLALPAALLERLAGHPRIVGVKDSSGDLDTFTAYRSAVPEWAVLVGSASLLLGALERGADGGVVAAACFAARLCAELYAAFRAGERERAVALQQRLGPLDREIVGRLGPAGVKAAMDAVGLHGGPVRPPLAPLDDRDRERIARLVRGD
ncbi:MAG TPA: dihydrodipicolinate synthase family protein [Gemmatimonadales bacterium]|nr:dihydrodipicolinate synthase family protein [Gemmatimonadales bacterium]